ncbi:MAG: PIN domain-containing protein [Streptosporangiales bacterium]|nr:PIN domain-containing protein [Streptosporangiales bacterium]
MGYLLDTMVISWAVRDLHQAPAVVRALRSEGDLAVSAISLLELRRGLPAEDYHRATDELVDVGVVPMDGAIAEAAGEYLLRCYEEGYRVDFFAGVIATTAARTGRALVTYSPAQYPLANFNIVQLASVLKR